MNYNRLKQYVAFREALQEEKAKLESQLERVKEALGISSSEVAPSPGRAPGPSRGRGGRRRVMSEEAKSRIAAAQRARWARIKGQSGAPAPAAAISGSRSRRGGGGMSDDQRAKIAAAQRARWARIRAAKGK